ncbi:acyl-CoA-binding domain-containing protein 3 [Ziziphus jujuba]|uniref:Acyl-CoA-binding domain-containing protein 3 n=1 Tax=Ziziphus jujuba TaxID=326968 RepID=A0A6P4A7N4_ZIZJJ|nr:acyl-CoA-binding domain-containing protein 3 [Ziziphus jujuba]XP_048335991.1 acyl-CoA-binding domain-containing protein 3-like [Ziziphus jujuba var. spinosa]
MEFFAEFFLTIAFAVGLFYVIFRLASAVPTNDAEDVNRKVGVFEFESEVESGFRDLVSERRVGFVGKIVEVDEFKGESEPEEFTVEEIADERKEIADEICGYSGLYEGSKSDHEDEVSLEVPVGSLTEKLTEKESHYFVNKSVDESSERDNLEEHEVDLIKDQVGKCESKDIEVTKCGDDKEDQVEIDGAKNNREVDDVKVGLLDDEDDWEGIERTELERLFGAAVAFVGSKSNADKISVLNNELKMKLHGLHMIATQGPCLEPQPMALKVSARAKWNAWQELGEMSRETAMELYVLLLSRKIPEWTPEQNEFGVFPKGEASGKVASFLKTVIQNQPEIEVEENLKN